MQPRSDGLYGRVAWVFLTLVLIIGCTATGRYGISWDEPMQRDMGNLCYDYVTGRSDSLFQIQNKYHNATWEFINVLPERLLGLKDMGDIYYSRHLLNFLVFWLASVYFYRLAVRIFRHKGWALLAVVMLYLTPRIVAHAFYNSKDLPFLSFFVLSVYAGYRFIERPGWSRLIWLSIVSGMLFGMRILGIILPFLVGGFFILNLFTGNLRRRDLRYLIGYAVLYPVCLYIFLPVLWPDPVFHFRQAFDMHSHFPYEDPILFMGQYVKPQDIPWYYVPVWMAITLPILWQLMFVVGILVALALTVWRHYHFLRDNWGIALSGLWLFMPWLMVVVLHSHIYDEWRHLFFTYPAFVLVGVFGARAVEESTRKYFGPRLRFVTHGFLYLLLCWQVLVTGVYMVRSHPHQYMYFNFLAGDRNTIHKRYEMDYWGLSYRQAWEYFFRHLPADKVDVEWQNNPGEYNLYWFGAEQRRHIRHVNYLQCQYFLTNYRWYPEYEGYREKFYSLKVDGIEIMTIFVNPRYTPGMNDTLPGTDSLFTPRPHY